MSDKTRILFLCTGNSCRSQMAEGWARSLKNDTIEAYSAGIIKHGLNSIAVRVMREAGVDISHHQSKTLRDIEGITFNYVVTLCDHASETCPVYPADAVVAHRSFDDPPTLARKAKTEEEMLAPYRRVRDEIRKFIQTLPKALATNTEQ